MSLAGAILLSLASGGLAFLLFLQRRSLGSWRGVAAVFCGVAVGGAVFLGLAFLFGRLGWLRTAPPLSAKGYGVLLLLGCASGGVGGVMSALVGTTEASVLDSAVRGAVLGASLVGSLWALNILTRSASSKSPAP